MSTPTLNDSTDAALLAYRLLNPDETIIEGDEYYSDDRSCWTASSSFGGLASESCFTYRRKVEPKEPKVGPAAGLGYRSLSVGEVIQADDEAFFASANTWVKTRNPGLRVQAIGLAYRRKEPPVTYTIDGIRPAAGPGYRRLSVGERLQADDEVFFPATGVWGKTSNPGFPVVNISLAYRRKVSPAPGYRFLRAGEITLEGDEFEHSPGEWLPVSMSIGTAVSEFDETNRLLRRKEPTPIGQVTPDPDAPAFNPGPGYRLLKAGELIEEGDEYRDSSEDRWETSWAVGDALHSENEGVYRRKVAPSIDPGPGYRLLTAHEPVEEGDEFFHHDAWLPTLNGGHGTAGLFEYPYRRSVVEPPFDWEGYATRLRKERDEARDELEARKEDRNEWEASYHSAMRQFERVERENLLLREACKETEERMLRNTHRYSLHRLKGRPLWAFVRDVTGTGSTSARLLCKAFGWNPDQSASEPLP